MKIISKNWRVRLTCLAGIGLLLVVVYLIVIEAYNCSILSTFFIRCSEQTPPGSSPAQIQSPLLTDTSRDIDQLLRQSEEDRARPYKKMPAQDIYLLSKHDYDNFMLGLSFMFLEAFGEYPSSETKPTIAIDFLRAESTLDYDLPQELAQERFEIRQIYRNLQREKKLIPNPRGSIITPFRCTRKICMNRHTRL